MDIQVLASSSAGNAYRVSDGHTSLLLDAGIPLRNIQRALGFGVARLDGCLVTHAHLDHVRGAADLMRHGVDVWASQGTIDAAGLTGHRIHRAVALEQLTIGSLRVLPFDVEHDAPEPLGFLLESTANRAKLLYFTDTHYIRYRFDGLTHIMAECNYSQAALMSSLAAGYVAPESVPRLAETHMSLERLLAMLAANDLSRVQQIWLLHLSDNNSDAEGFRRAVQRATGAEVYIARKGG